MRGCGVRSEHRGRPTAHRERRTAHQALRTTHREPRTAHRALRTAHCIALLLALSSPAFAQRLPRTATPEHYDLAFRVDIGQRRFEGTETIRILVSQPTSRIVLNAAELAFTSVAIEAAGRVETPRVSFSPATETATLTTTRPIPAGSAEIRVRYTGTLNDRLRGFYITRGNGRDYAVTQFESTDARRAFPCFDEPAYKATFTIALTIDRRDTAISNGRIVSDTPGPGASEHTLRFSTTPRMSSYLVAMAVGDFACLEATTDDIPIRICATPDKKDLGAIALESARAVLQFYNRYYAVSYPFGKLDVLAVPDFAAGAMENTAAIFARETDLLASSAAASVATRKNIASLLAHEMAHQWFGDLVTMTWWDDIWLNEGFATWMANRPLAAWKPEWNIGVDEAIENQKALSLDALRATRPVRAPVDTPTEIDAAFDAISYEKGAALLRMIESYVGPDAFRAGINRYLQAHAYGSATSRDFWTAMTAASGKPVDRILPTFIDQPGVPRIEVSTPTCAGSTAAIPSVTLQQQRFSLAPAPRAPSERWQIPVCFKREGAASQASTCTVLTEPRQSVHVGGSCSGLVFANAGAQGYYRTAHSLDTLRALSPRVQDVLTAPERLTLVDDEWALVTRGQRSAADFLSLASAFSRESSSGVLREVTEHLDALRQHATTAGTRARFEGFVRAVLQPLVAQLGTSSSASDTDDRGALRAVAVEALGTTGNDADIVAMARTLLDRALAGGAPLDPALADAVVNVAAEHGDRTLFDALTIAGVRATSPDERQRYYFAAADFREPALIDRGLERTLSGEIRSQDVALYLASFFANPVARPRAWSFVTSNWNAVAPNLSIFNADVTLTAALGSFCDAGARDSITTFFRAHPLPGAARTLEQSIERITACIQMRGTQTKNVSDFLAARP